MSATSSIYKTLVFAVLPSSTILPIPGNERKELSAMVMFPLWACPKEWDDEYMAAAEQKSAFWDSMSKS
jgi:hypothetical protein